MLSKKDLQLLDANKADRLKVQKGLPARHEGKNGDLSVRQVPSGLGLYGKFHDKWYRIAKLEDITRDGQIPIGQGENKTFGTIEVDRIVLNKFPNKANQLGKSSDGSKFISKKTDDGNTYVTLMSNQSGVVQDGPGTTYFFKDSRFKILDNSDATKIFSFECSGITTGNSRILTVPNANGTIALTTDIINFEGSTANGVLTYKDADEMAVESTLIFDGTDLSISSTGKLVLGAGAHTFIHESSDDIMTFSVGGTTMLTLTEDSTNSMAIPAVARLYLDGGTHTYIVENADDQLSIFVGADVMMIMTEKGGSGNQIKLGAPIGWQRGTTAYSYNNVTTSGGTDDTDVDFRWTQKIYLRLTGDVVDLNFIFPTVSANFDLILNQSSSGGPHTITDYKAWISDDDGNLTGVTAATTSALLFAGGSDPTLTTTADKSDIISILWDATAQKAYATIELNF